ncbi:hypothetical protein [uncultured Polaribacter sp.]|uniref:hypothetical protein n=1 Tax=uncultured Polaribacter sp. TaxID=174711 RepID=UPI002605E8FD|nr:hypothetical protein [uncultured Polaribacter sp.]
MKPWIRFGLAWGLYMFVGMTFVWPLIDGEEITFKNVIVKFVLHMLFGLLFGYVSSKYKKYKYVIRPEKNQKN